MENKVVGGQWLGPVDGLPHGFYSLFISQSCTFFGINSRNSQETNPN
jgi:hypothetical protein